MDQKNKRSSRKWIGLVLLALFLLLAIFAITQFKTNGRINSGGRIRKYLIYVPDSYDPAAPAPLVISIHGFVQWPAHQQDMTGWNQLADEFGFLVVYPRGTGFPLRWNTRSATDVPGPETDDLQFFIDLLDHLQHSYSIDADRIYVNGMSNGGGMADLLACEMSQRIAAIGGVAGAYHYPREDCQPQRPVPVIAFHGLDDEVVPYRGGASSRDDRFIFPPVEDWAASWAVKNGCFSAAREEPASQHVQRIDYPSCEGHTRVILYKVEDGGHTWPGGEKLPVWIAGKTNREIDASRLMWEFYLDHPLYP